LIDRPEKLYLYSAIFDGVIDCRDLPYKGNFNYREPGPPKTWNATVPRGKTGWFRFQTAQDPCPTNKNRVDFHIPGGKDESLTFEIH
jgi:hypothetical protein